MRPPGYHQCCGLLMTTYMCRYIDMYIYKYMTYMDIYIYIRKAVHTYMCPTVITTMAQSAHMVITTFILQSLLSLLMTLWFIGTSNV